MNIKVVAVDYREGPDNKFPAASEDVASVYRELLKAYKPQNIAIYGCSAGGMLTAMSLAWFQTHALAAPGAVGIYCASAGAFGGDATYIAFPFGEGRMPPTRPPGQSQLGYFSGADMKDPLVSPTNSPAILAKFPPTLLITGTRHFAMSGTIHTDTELIKRGVKTELHVWDGLFHGFFYNADVPESRDAFNAMINFFDRILGRSSSVALKCIKGAARCSCAQNSESVDATNESESVCSCFGTVRREQPARDGHGQGTARLVDQCMEHGGSSAPPFPGLPPPPVFENQTVRMVVRMTIGGQQIRLRFSNAFGTSPLEIGSAHVALTAHNAAIVAHTDQAITFDGRPSVKIPPRGAYPAAIPSQSMSRPSRNSLSSILPAAQRFGFHDAFLGAACEAMSPVQAISQRRRISRPASAPTSWYFLSDVEVWAADRAAAVVALGDSITDGAGAKQGTYEDWPDQLAKRLSASAGGTRVAILNEGIGGNRILHDGAGVNALARFDRDVLDQPGIQGIILLEGINDIGWPHMKLPPPKDGSAPKVSPFAAQIVTADDLIAGYRQIIDRAHQHHIRVFAATMTPYEGADYFTADGEAVRQAVNQWIPNQRRF